MATFILAGFQQTLSADLKKSLAGASSQMEGWTYEYIPGERRNEPYIGSRQIEVICRAAERHDGAHILAVSAERDRQLVQNQIRPYFRFRWLDPKLISLTARGETSGLIEHLQSAISEEQYWRDVIRPKNCASPLILPEIFAAQRDLADVWRLAESYGNRGHLEAAADRIDRFTQSHRRRIDNFVSMPWLDANSWIWDDSGAKHGLPAFPKDWKYSFKMADGFHFDVSCLKKNRKNFTDRLGTQHALAKGYLNVTAHGEIRGS